MLSPAGSSYPKIETVSDLDDALTDPSECKNDQQRLVSQSYVPPLAGAMRRPSPC